MFAERDVVVVGGARTAIGDYGGSLEEVSPTRLAAIVIREAVRRAGVNPNEIDLVVFGNVIHSEPKDMYLSRVAAVDCAAADSKPSLPPPNRSSSARRRQRSREVPNR